MKTANIAAIDRLRCGTDGVGIRTLVCFAGCPLRCKYCPNKFTYNGSCAPQTLTEKQLYDKVKIDKLYFDATGGGITFGGGEPLLQFEFIKRFMISSSKSSSPKTFLSDTFVIETSLSISNKRFKAFISDLKILSFHKINLVLYVDVKTLNPKEYKKYTHKSIRCLKKNLKILSEKNIYNLTTVFRVPLIDGYVSKESQIRTVAKLQKMGFYNIEKFKYATYN